MTTEEILQKAKEKMKTFFSGVVTPEEIEALKQWVKLAGEPAGTPPPPAPKTVEAKTKDGKILSIEGEVKSGSVVKESTTEGLKDLADGDYILIDAENKETTIKVAGGKITDVVAPALPAPADVIAEMAKLSEQFKTQLSEQKTCNDTLIAELKKDNETLKKQVVSLTNHVTKMLETPINTPATGSKKFEDMSPLEQFRAMKELKHGK